MFALWIGALYPLLMISRTEQVAELKVSLERFSKHAVVIVLFLLSGLALMLSSYILRGLFTTAYVIALILKILLVIGLVAIAAMNKYIIVPRLLLQTDTAQFQRSVRIEIVVAILLLLLTAYLSTALGPTMH